LFPEVPPEKTADDGQGGGMGALPPAGEMLGEAVARAEDAIREAAQHRKPGEVWQGDSGRWFTINDHGHVAPHRAPGGGDARPKAAAQPRPDPAANRPSLPGERHPDKTLPRLPWRAPPEPKGRAGGGPAVRGVGLQSQTVLGDKIEAISESLGLRNILPEGKRNFSAREVAEKGSSIDREFDHSGKLCEIKMCRTTATEYRLKAKAEEKEAKLKFAQHSQGEVVTVVPVWDVDTNEVHFYWHDGLTGSDVRGGEKAGWSYMGTVKVEA
jgi:hypothetical protein